MNTGMRVLNMTVALMLSAASLTGTAAGTADGVEDQGTLEHLGNFSFPAWSAGNVRAARFTVKKLDGQGKPICVQDEQGNCVLDETGAIVYETEQRDFAFAARRTGPSAVLVVDITDPTNPVLAAEVPSVVPAVEGALDVRADLGLLVAVQTNSLAIVDVSDPRFPTVKSTFSQTGPGPHSVTLHPTQPYAYVPLLQLYPSVGQTSVFTPIVDLTNPAAPVRVQNFAFHVQSPHTLTFNASGTRAYAASFSHTDIWNTSNPRSPSVIATIHDPSVKFHGYAQATPDGRYLTVTDHLGVEVTCPAGAVHFYDLTVEAAPVKVAAYTTEFAATTTLGGCGPNYHAMQGSLMAVPWKLGGTWLVDISAPIGTGGTTVARSSTSLNPQRPEGAIFYQGNIVTVDYTRGLDIFKLP